VCTFSVTGTYRCKKAKKTSDDTLYTILLSTATQNGNIDSNELVPQKKTITFQFFGF